MAQNLELFRPSLTHDIFPNNSQIYHRYAAAIKANAYEDKRLTLKYQISIEDAKKTWLHTINKTSEQSYLVDVIFERLEKMNRERRYCNRYSRTLYTVDAIRASIEIIDDKHTIIETIMIPELDDRGYPEDKIGYLKDLLKDYCGSALHQRLTPSCNGESV